MIVMRNHIISLISKFKPVQIIFVFMLVGLSPKEIVPFLSLNMMLFTVSKQIFQILSLGINGGITTLEETKQHLKHVDSVMIGRWAHKSYVI